MSVPVKSVVYGKDAVNVQFVIDNAAVELIAPYGTRCDPGSTLDLETVYS